jgi:hypothetical protein
MCVCVLRFFKKTIRADISFRLFLTTILSLLQNNIVVPEFHHLSTYMFRQVVFVVRYGFRIGSMKFEAADTA